MTSILCRAASSRGLLLGAVLLAGCASAPPEGSYQASVQLQPIAAPAAADPGMSALPTLPVAQMEDPGAGGRRIEQLEVVNQDIRLVVRSLAESFGLDYQVDPAIQGQVTTRLQGVTLSQALDAVVLPHGYEYQLQGNVLRVTAARVQSRIFTLDYVSLSRAGVGTTVVQRRLGATGGGGGFGGQGQLGGAGLAGGGGDVIQSVSVFDLWEEIRVSLEGLIFEGAGVVAEAPVAPTAGGAGLGGGARATGAFSRTAPDGRRLIINPISGTILVAASPEKLDEVATFIATIEGSVQRQVLIEAKIVEVALNRSSQFGINWDVIRSLGGANISVGAGSGGVALTLGSSNGVASPTESVNLVLQALERQGEVSVLSAPRVSVMNNQRAVMNVARDEVFFSVTRQPILGPNGGTIAFDTEIIPQQVAVGIVLDVIAQISPDNTITMNVRPVITDVVEEKSVQLEDGTQATAPVIDRRETDTMARVRGGETIVIGGLMQSTRRKSESGVPFLRDIPGVGRLFQGSTDETAKRELVIFITPTIIASQPPISQ